MIELFLVWRNTRLVVLVAVIAAVYAACLIPFKVVLPFIPGFTEFRPAAVIPIVCSIMFGPAAAWGAAFGNLIGDLLGGTFGLGSIFGFPGNLMYGLLPYLLWRSITHSAQPTVITPKSKFSPKGIFIIFLIIFILTIPVGVVITLSGLFKMTPISTLPVFYPFIVAAILSLIICSIISLISMGKHSLQYGLVTLGSCLVCGLIIGWGLDLLGLVPFNILANIIFLNNFIVSILLGPALLNLLYPRVEKWGLLYSEIGEKKPPPTTLSFIIGIILVITAIVGFIIGNITAPATLYPLLPFIILIVGFCFFL